MALDCRTDEALAGERGDAARSKRKEKLTRPDFRPYHSITVPREADLEEVFHGREDSVAVTTLMLRHIPNKYTQACMLKELELQGFGGCVDFFYMPMDVQNRANVGYAFINFVTADQARRFIQRFSTFRFRVHPSSRIGSVSPAHVQGLAANVHHFANKAVIRSKNSCYRPIVIRDGRQLDISIVLRELKGASGRGRGTGAQLGSKVAHQTPVPAAGPGAEKASASPGLATQPRPPAKAMPAPKAAPPGLVPPTWEGQMAATALPSQAQAVPWPEALRNRAQQVGKVVPYPGMMLSGLAATEPARILTDGPGEPARIGYSCARVAVSLSPATTTPGSNAEFANSPRSSSDPESEGQHRDESLVLPTAMAPRTSLEAAVAAALVSATVPGWNPWLPSQGLLGCGQNAPSNSNSFGWLRAPPPGLDSTDNCTGSTLKQQADEVDDDLNLIGACLLDDDLDSVHGDAAHWTP